MNFADEMAALTPGEVRTRIVGRLRDGHGPAWNDSRGEPRWGLLLSAFNYWRRNEAQLQAVDCCLDSLVPELFAEQAWPAVEAACGYVLALGDLEHPWHPGQIDRWPFKDWLRPPQQGAPGAQLQALGSALQLMRSRKLVQAAWAGENFRQVATKLTGAQGSSWALYLLDSWKAWAEVTEPDEGVVGARMWFELLRQTRRLGTGAFSARVLSLAMDWALGRCLPTEREAMLESLLSAIRQLPYQETTDSEISIPQVTANSAALQAFEDVFADFPQVAVATRRRPTGHGVLTLHDRSITHRLSEPPWPKAA